MTLPYKLLAFLIAVLSAAGIGYWKGKQNAQVITKTETIHEKGETRTIVQDRIVTRTVVRKPDGTTTETTKEETVAKNTDKTQTETEVSSEKKPSGSTGSPAGNYRAGINYWASSISDLQGSKNRGDHIGINAGYRLIGPVWIDGQALPFGNKKEVALGLSVEF